MKSVAKYLAEFRNIVLTINGMNDEEKADRFKQGLKYNVRVEVLKARVESFEDCAQVALNVDSAMWRAGEGAPSISYNNNEEQATPWKLAIFNTENHRRLNANIPRKIWKPGHPFTVTRSAADLTSVAPRSTTLK